jgi:hypothetical protein
VRQVGYLQGTLILSFTNTKSFGPSGLSTVFKNTNKYAYRCFEIRAISHPAAQIIVR